MAFNPSNWSTVSSSGARPAAASGGSFIGAPALFNYISNVDLQAAISGANYFAKQAYILSVGDQIYTVDSANVPTTYMVSVVTVAPTGNTVTIINAAPAAGDVIGPAVAVDNALARFDGASGKVIQNGVILESDAGDLTLVNSIANAAGLLATPSYTFTGDLDTGMWHSAANTLDFSTNAFRSLQLAASPAASVNYSVITASAAGTPVILSAAGADVNVGIRLQPKGTGGVINNVGAEATPSYTFTGDLDTGIYHSAAGAVDFASNGVRVFGIGDIVQSISVFGAAGTAGGISLYNILNDHHVDLSAPGALAVNADYTLPLLAPTSDGQVLSSTTAGVMSWSSSVPLSWVAAPASVNPMVVNTGYVTTNGALDTMTLPATANLGDVIEIVGQGAGGWLIAQNANQVIHQNGTSSSVGAGGSFASTNRYNSIRLVCVVAGASTEYTVASGSGNFTIV